MADFPLPLLGFSAYSGTGKTTLLCKIIPLLKNKGYRIALIKHTHHNIDIDKPGKDSYRLRESGASQVVIASRNRTATIIEHPQDRKEPLLSNALANLQTDVLDLVLIEGFKHAELAKIELHRKVLEKPYLYPDDPNIIGIAADHNIDDQHAPFQMDLNQPQQIVEFIESRVLKV